MIIEILLGEEMKSWRDDGVPTDLSVASKWMAFELYSFFIGWKSVSPIGKENIKQVSSDFLGQNVRNPSRHIPSTWLSDASRFGLMMMNTAKTNRVSATNYKQYCTSTSMNSSPIGDGIEGGNRWKMSNFLCKSVVEPKVRMPFPKLYFLSWFGYIRVGIGRLSICILELIGRRVAALFSSILVCSVPITKHKKNWW